MAKKSWVKLMRLKKTVRLLERAKRTTSGIAGIVRFMMVAVMPRRVCGIAAIAEEFEGVQHLPRSVLDPADLVEVAGERVEGEMKGGDFRTSQGPGDLVRHGKGVDGQMGLQAELSGKMNQLEDVLSQKYVAPDEIDDPHTGFSEAADRPPSPLACPSRHGIFAPLGASPAPSGTAGGDPKICIERPDPQARELRPARSRQDLLEGFRTRESAWSAVEWTKPSRGNTVSMGCTDGDTKIKPALENINDAGVNPAHDYRGVEVPDVPYGTPETVVPPIEIHFAVDGYADVFRPELSQGGEKKAEPLLAV